MSETSKEYGGANHKVLVEIALTKLRSTRPEAWDFNALSLYNVGAETAFPESTKDDREAAWRDALAVMRDTAKTEWDEYARFKKDGSATSLPWDKVKLVKGQADGDTFELFFDVDGIMCVIECSDVQLLDPSYIQRKLVMYTRKDVVCPYLGKKKLEAWRRDVVIPWLKSANFQLTDRETAGEVITSLIQEFCADSVAVETGQEVWQQVKRPILDAGMLYVPFSGLQSFVSRRVGGEPSKRSIKNILSRLGFNVVMKGKARLRFHSITMEKLYEKDTDPGQAGSGKIDKDSEGSERGALSGRVSILDQLREEERDGLAPESGQRSADSKTQEGPDNVPDDPFASLP
jgi:hypothetical protein